METNQLFIPEKIKVGQQERKDCFTGRLGFVVYYGKDGSLKQETSWNGWRDKKIEPLDFDNTPMEGFVLNKNVGGVRESYGHNARNEYCRVYDPRGFEFEISLPNLLLILRDCNSYKGKGLEGKFVYAWGGPKVVLLPVESEDYRNSCEFTSLKEKSISVRDLKLGATYRTKKQQALTYIGKFNYYYSIETYEEESRNAGRFSPDNKGVCKKFVFHDGENFVHLNGIASLAVLQSDAVTPEYANLSDQYVKSIHGSKPVELFLKPYETPEEPDRWGGYNRIWYTQERDGTFSKWTTSKVSSGERKGEINHTSRHGKFKLCDGVLQYTRSYYSCNAYPHDKAHSVSRSPWVYGESRRTVPYVEPTDMQLWVRFESGAEHPFDSYKFNQK